MSTVGSSGKDSLPNVSWNIKLLMEFGALLFCPAMCPNMTLNRHLLKIFDPKVATTSKPKNYIASFDSSRNLWFRLYTSSTATKLPFVLYFHGGSYVFGGANSFGNDASCRHVPLPPTLGQLPHRARAQVPVTAPRRSQLLEIHRGSRGRS
ncbi:hypothetical protein M0R45_017001 [Rubus argutus]|uniref:Uncharacterized protein n=1 Tax=Rubus argutus TaxID=59490 RepID=A0AAW1XX01_RUBAR